jgi:cysteine-rich repeat protein
VAQCQDVRSLNRYAGLLLVGVLGCWLDPSPDPPVPPVVCGDGVKAGVEQCDSGAANSDTEAGACRTTCVLAGCGDRVIDPDEACDDGNRVAGDGCAASCRKIEQCGDGILDPGAEQCDDGAENSDALADRCRTSCMRPRCGDGVADREEECDDGNLENGDSCDSNCTAPRCGNRVTGAGEECDDGNTFNTDACRPDCMRNTCSGGVDREGNRCFVVQSFAVPDSDLRSVEIADVDGNGWDDIIVVDREDDSLKLFWNSNGTFTRVEQWVAEFYSLTGDKPVDVAVGDINGDGRLDLATANENKDLVCILENKGNRTFARHFFPVTGQPTDVTLANIDGQAGLEVLVGLDNDDQVRVIRLNRFVPYGMVQAVSATSPTSLGAGDVDGDGDADITWATSSPGLAVNEGGTLVKVSIANSKSSIDTARLWDLDGTPPDELVTGVYGLFTSEHLRVFMNTDTTNASIFDAYAEAPVSKYPVYLARSGSEVAYADNGGTFGVLRNEGGALSDERIFTYDGEAKGLASGDLDKDGAPELVITSPDKEAVLVFWGR